MGITLDRGRYYFVLNVPKHLFGKALGRSGQPVKQIRQALNTADKSVAKRKAFELEELKQAEWQLLVLGEDALAYEKFQAAKQLARSHGFDYLPSDVLLKKSFEENLPRMQAAVGSAAKPAAPEVLDVLLGGVDVALPPLRVALQEFIDLTKTKHLRKSDKQRHLWRLPRERAVKNFEAAVPDRKASGLDQITREDALSFRNWWAKRIEAGETRAETANKDLGHLSQLFREWCELKGHTDLSNPFAKLRFDKAIDPLVTRPAFSKAWLEHKVLADGALDGLNDEAADALLVMVNTGLRPSEVLNCPLEAAFHAFQTMPNSSETQRRDKASFAFLMLRGARIGAVWHRSSSSISVWRNVMCVRMAPRAYANLSRANRLPRLSSARAPLSRP